MAVSQIEMENALKYVRYMMENSLGIGAVCLILVTIFDIPIK